MNITPRTCANCTSFDPMAKDGDTCLNLVSFTHRKPGQMDAHRSPAAVNHCDDHQTAEEAATHGL